MVVVTADTKKKDNAHGQLSRNSIERSGRADFDLLEQRRDNFVSRFGAEISLSVHAHTNGAGFHVAFADDKHGVDFHLFGALDFTVDLVRAFVDFSAHLMSRSLVV